MGTDKRARQKEGRQARIAAAEAAQRKAATRQKVLSVAGILLLVVLVGAAISYFGKDDGKSDVASTDTTVEGLTDPSDLASTFDTAALESAAGKPCVALADPLPTGSPDVPVKVGPPPTTLVKEDLVVGTGAEVTAGDTVTVNYTGVACSTGKIFDSSYTNGQPATFSLDRVITGWTEGIPGMKVGGRRLLGIPSAMAYGAQGSGEIAPDEALWFVVDVTNTVAATASTSTSLNTP